MKKFFSIAIVVGLMAFAYFKFVPESERFDLKKLFGGKSDSTINVITASEAQLFEKAADPSSKVITTVYVGDTVENIGLSTEIVNNEEFHYHHVKTKDGKKGWISDEFIGIGVLPAAIMKETRILKSTTANDDTEKSFLTGDFVVALKKEGDFVLVRGQGRDRELYNESGIITGYVPALALTYAPIDISFATKQQRALDEKDEVLQDSLLAVVRDADLWMNSDLFIALHSKSFDEEETEDEGDEEEDPGFGIAQFELMPPSDGLVAYYKMNHLAVSDETDYHHDGQYVDIGTDYDKNGSAMAAWSFNGKSSYVTIDQWRDNPLQPPFTVAAYVKLADINTKMGTIASRGRSAEGTGFNFGYAMKDNGQRVFYFGMIGAEGPISAEAPTDIAAGEWVYLAISYEEGYMKLYINGALAKSEIANKADVSTILYNFEESNEPFEIGRELRSLGRYFNGSIDNLAIWNRVLTDEEIADMNH